jgi:hypothetical protein
MAVHGEGPSPALLEANRRLYNLRAANQQQPTACGSRWPIVGDRPASELAPACQQCAPGRERPTGGGRRLAADQCASEVSPTITVYPDLALAILRQGRSAAGRVWLLLRHLDREGRGWLPLEEIRRQLAGANSPSATRSSPLRICGRRQLRNLLQQGRGHFWDLDPDRLWLKSAAKVALALGVRRLSGRPVALPIKVLLGGIGQVRAHLYATFHSGRDQDNPISRRTLEKITHVPARTQRAYDRVAGVINRANIALGQFYASSTKIVFSNHYQERAWRHGRAVFTFVDHRGQQGPAGRRYLAWRLPNSYQGPHQQRPKGRQKKINRQIDLVTKRAQGNGLPARGRFMAAPLLFHPDGRSAAWAATRISQDANADLYWPQPRSTGKHRLWHVLSCFNTEKEVGNNSGNKLP